MLTVTGPPEQLGGPVADLYDTPFVAVLAGDGVVRGYSANSRECAGVCACWFGVRELLATYVRRRSQSR
jgi:hypothetical protein